MYGSIFNDVKVFPDTIFSDNRNEQYNIIIIKNNITSFLFPAKSVINHAK